MIKYILKCHNDHEFESWFSNSDEFDKLKKKNLLECIFCSSKKVNKSIMSPMISSYKENENYMDITNKDFKNQKAKLLQLRKYIEKNFDFVGKDFSKLEKFTMIKKVIKLFMGQPLLKKEKSYLKKASTYFQYPGLTKIIKFLHYL